MSRWKILFIGLAAAGCLFPRNALVEGKKKKPDGMVIEGFVAKGLYLFEYGSNDSFPVQGAPKPNRVHVRFSPEFNEWVFVMTDLWGRFADPPEVLVAGSVVSGESIGATPGQRYLFQPGGRWLPTPEPRRLKLVVLGAIPSYKTVTYEPLGDSRLPFVNPEYQVDFRTFDPFALR